MTVFQLNITYKLLKGPIPDLCCLQVMKEGDLDPKRGILCKINLKLISTVPSSKTYLELFCVMASSHSHVRVIFELGLGNKFI